MSVSSGMEKKVIRILIIVFVVAGALLLAKRLGPKDRDDFREVSVKIEGHVRKPGTYRVPYGTTRFEILKVAGVYQNSDLNGLNVYAQVSDKESMQVGRLEKDVSLKPGGTPGCFVNFFIGDVTVSDEAGKRKLARNTEVKEGQKIICGPDGVVELKMADGTIIDLKKGSVFTVKSLYRSDPAGFLTVSFELASGRLWAFVSAQPQNVSMAFASPHLVAAIKGTEFEMAVDAAGSRVNCIKGIIALTHAGSSETVTITEGQKGMAGTDAAKGVETGNITDAEKDEDMAAFNAEKNKALSQNDARRFLYLGLPDYYMLNEIDPSVPRVVIYRIDPKTPVKDYIDGVDELGKVYLYGGIGLVSSIVERICGKKIEKYLIHDREDVVQFIDNLGGVVVNLDEEDAKAVGLKRGSSKLTGQQALKYFSPARDGREGSIDRQNEALRSIFTALSEQRIVYSTALAAKLVTNVQTDMNAAYMGEVLDVLKKKSGWKVEFSYLVGK